MNARCEHRLVRGALSIPPCGKLARFEVRIGDRWEPRCTLHKGDGEEVRLA